ncbi:MAG: DNA gyrase C-terminal beta-propeller domain-containing protein [Thermomicrobiales bacterium]
MVRPDQTVMLISSSGQVIRMPASQISLIGRATQGVTVMKPKPNEVVVSVAVSDPSTDRSEENASLNGKAIS